MFLRFGGATPTWLSSISPFMAISMVLLIVRKVTASVGGFEVGGRGPRGFSRGGGGGGMASKSLFARLIAPNTKIIKILVKILRILTKFYDFVAIFFEKFQFFLQPARFPTPPIGMITLPAELI